MEVLGFLPSLFPGILAVLVVGIPWLVKRVVGVCAEKAVGGTFERRFEKYKAELSKATMAREVMLKREMAFYDTIDVQIAELVPLIQDLRDNLIAKPFTEEKKDCLVRVPELTIEMKDTSLRYEAYVAADVWMAFNELVVELQSQCDRWLYFAKKISREIEIDSEDIDAAGEMCDKVLFLVALVRARQGNYLKFISSDE